jgi:hypothetical protein
MIMPKLKIFIIKFFANPFFKMWRAWEGSEQSACEGEIGEKGIKNLVEKCLP